MNNVQSRAPRLGHYNNDGHGRDSYIKLNNGGFYPEARTHGYHKMGTFVLQKQRAQQPLARIHSKPLYYKSNGSGRDGYIGIDSGGLINPFAKGTFYTGLRKQDPPAVHHRYSPDNSPARREAEEYQRSFDQRLSQPKKLDRMLANRKYSESVERVFRNS